MTSPCERFAKLHELFFLFLIPISLEFSSGHAQSLVYFSQR